jgi:lipoyl(octanoyl) transferase
MNKQISIKDLGLIDYKACWDYQEQLFSEILAIKSVNRKENKALPTKNHLILCEHPHVYTLGRNGNKKNLLINNLSLKNNNAVFHKTNRGGDITYHGPGQIVVYPILDLENFFKDIHKYLRFLEESVILTLKEYGVFSERSKGETGVWIDVGTKRVRKICAIGVKSSRWATMHGFAFNINSNLSYFKNIVPCGINDKNVTSLQEELGEKIHMQEIKSKLTSNLVRLFEMEIV